MEPVKCQNCKGRKNESKDYKGCSTCSGYGIVFEVCNCPVCKKEYLSRPGNYTIYEGKRHVSVDGLTIIYDLTLGGLCENCYKLIHQ